MKKSSLNKIVSIFALNGFGNGNNKENTSRADNKQN